MNAHELADWLNDPLGYKMGEIATMLRQQAEEINNLKQWQRRQLDVIANLEAQVYGGTTK